MYMEKSFVIELTLTTFFLSVGLKLNFLSEKRKLKILLCHCSRHIHANLLPVSFLFMDRDEMKTSFAVGKLSFFGKLKFLRLNFFRACYMCLSIVESI